MENLDYETESLGTPAAKPVADEVHDKKSEDLSFEEKFPFLLANLRQVIPPLLDLLDLDACEVYLGEKSRNSLVLVYHHGRLQYIWEVDAARDENSLLLSQYAKKEMRVVNLPNSRVKELNVELREKAIGQLICLPLFSDDEAFGVACFAHSRRNLLTDREMNFLQATGASLSEGISYEIRNQQARVQIISEERKRIGMDLHDGIIQSLYGIGLSLENARMS